MLEMSRVLSIWRGSRKFFPVCTYCSVNGLQSGASTTADVRFDSPEAVTRGKSAWEVFRGWLVFKLFSYDTLVDNGFKVYMFVFNNALSYALGTNVPAPTANATWDTFGTMSIVSRLYERGGFYHGDITAAQLM